MALFGTLLTLAADQGNVSYLPGPVVPAGGTTPVPFDSEVYDTAGAYNGTPGQIVIPAEADGQFWQFGGCVQLSAVAGSSGVEVVLLRNGASNFPGCCRDSKSISPDGRARANFESRAIPVAAGEVYSFGLLCTDPNINIIASGSNFGGHQVG
jgi:hypothetical protein